MPTSLPPPTRAQQVTSEVPAMLEPMLLSAALVLALALAFVAPDRWGR